MGPIGEFEGLQIVKQDHCGSCFTRVGRLSPAAKELLAPGTTLFVAQLQLAGRRGVVVLIVKGPAVAHGEVIVFLLVTQEYKHAQCFADLDDTAQRLGLRVQAALNVHPALNATESRGHIDDFQHVNNEGLEDDCLLTSFVPVACHFPGDIEVFLDQFVLLNDQNILNRVAHGTSGLASTSVEGNEEFERFAVGSSLNVTVGWK